MEVPRRYSERRGGLIILTVTIGVVILIVVSGILVSIFVERFVANIVLGSLIVLLVFVGAVSYAIIRLQSREAERRRDMGSEYRAAPVMNDRSRRIEPSAPPMSTRTSWALVKPWKSSKRSTNLERA